MLLNITLVILIWPSYHVHPPPQLVWDPELARIAQVIFLGENMNIGKYASLGGIIPSPNKSVRMLVFIG